MGLQSRLIFKYSFSNPLFTQHELLLNWSLSDTVLITAYDLLKDDFLVNRLSRSGSTLTDYLHALGFNPEIKILADTGIFEFEARKSKLMLPTLESFPHELTTDDIFYAYDLIDPDFLISPDHIILQTDFDADIQTKISAMIEDFYQTVDRFPKQKIISVLQGFDRPTLDQLLDVYTSEHISSVARGGLIPLWFDSKVAFEDVVQLTDQVAHEHNVIRLHSFGLPALTTIKSYFLDNNYSSLDTSIVYYRTAQREYLLTKGFFVSVNKVSLVTCSCVGCQIMHQRRYSSYSSEFVIGLYYHNCLMLTKLVDKLLQTNQQVFLPKKYFYNTNTISSSLITHQESSSALTYAPATTLLTKTFSPLYIDQKEVCKQEYSILVLQACTKRKNLLGKAYALRHLRTTEQRAQILLKDEERLPARDLYTTSSMNDTVDFIRSKGFSVDYMFISAGFGLVTEQTPLPNYDASFNGKSNGFLTLRTKELGLTDSLTSLAKYDLIYLNLPDTYLAILDFNLIHSKTTELVYFSAQTSYVTNTISINPLELRELDRRTKKLPVSLQTHAKEQILKNFSLYKIMNPTETFQAFIQSLFQSTYAMRVF